MALLARTIKGAQPPALTPLPAKTADEMQEMLSIERSKLNELHRRRERIGSELGDWMIEKQTGGSPSPGKMADLMTEQAQVDQEISHQGAIVQRIEARLWEWRARDEARQYDQDCETMRRTAASGLGLEAQYVDAVRTLLDLVNQMDLNVAEFSVAHSRASRYWSQHDAPVPPESERRRPKRAFTIPENLFREPGRLRGLQDVEWLIKSHPTFGKR